MSEASGVSSPQRSNQDGEDDNIMNKLAVHSYVEVEDRLWPGMNKFGGVAKVLDIDKGNQTVDVHYVVDRRKEKKISIEFIRLAPEYDPSYRVATRTAENPDQPIQQSANLRDRSMLLGRCTLCGSLRTDCGSCDWKQETEQFQQLQNIQMPTTSAANKKKRKDDNLLDSSSSEDELDELILKHQKAFRNLKRRQARQRREHRESIVALEKEKEEAEAAAKKAKTARNKASWKTAEFERNKSNKLPKGVLSDSSSDEDNDTTIRRLALGNQRKGRLSRLQKKYSASSQASRKRPRSVLESLPTSTADPSGQRRNNRHPHLPEESTPRKENQSSADSDANRRNEDQLDGSSNMENVFTMDVDDDDDDCDAEQQIYNGTSTQYIEDIQDDCPLPVEDSNENYRNPLGGEILEGFIEPEGDDAAESLPQDIVDRSEGVAFTELPEFFNKEYQVLADEKFPAAKLKVATLERQVYKRTSQSREGSAATTSFDRLLDMCEEEMQRIRVDLIQNGTDQARSALRKFLDDRRYKRERSTMSETQRKNIRRQRDVLSFSMDSKMDELDREVQALMNKIRTLQSNLYQTDHDADCGDQDSSSDGNAENMESSNMSSDSDNHGIQDDEGEDDAPLARLAVELPPWEKHQYARRIRNPKPQTHKGRKTRDLSGHSRRKQQIGVEGRRSGLVNGSATSTNLATKSRKTTNQTSERTVDQENCPPNQIRKRSKNGRYFDKLSRVEKQAATVESSPPDNMNVEDDGRERRHVHTSRSGAGVHASARERNVRVPRHGAASNDCAQEFTASAIPRLDDLLPATDESIEYARTDGRFNTNQRSIADRMAAFLLVNDVAETDDSDLDSEFTAKGRNVASTRGLRHNNSLTTNIPKSSRFEAEPFKATTRRQHVTSRKEPLQQNNTTKSNSMAGHNRPVNVVRRQRGDHEHPPSGTLSVEVKQGQKEDREEIDVWNSSSQGTSHEFDEVHSLTSAYFFERLEQQNSSRKIQAVPAVEGAASDFGDEDLSGRCRSIERAHASRGEQTFVPELKSLTARVARRVRATSSGAKSCAVLGFRTLLELLQSNSKTTLQEALTRCGKSFRDQIVVLTETLSLIESGAGALLQPEDGIVYLLFSPSNCTKFIRAVILQFVDSLYCVFLPGAWAHSFENRSDKMMKSGLEALHELIPLRDALAGVTNLIESVCSCLASHFESQTWRLVESPEKHAFVSSVDPEEWSCLLETGADFGKPTNCRISHFKNGIPRCEVEALWSIIGYAANAKIGSGNSSNSDVATRVLTKFLIQGILVSKKPPEDVPIDPAHLEACCKEIHFLASLLRVGAIDKLPKNDDSCIEIIKKAVKLQNEAYIAHGKHPVFRTASSDTRMIRSIGKAFDMNPGDVALFHTPENSKSLSIGNTNISDFLDQKLLLPSSLTVRKSLGLLSSWIAQVPSTKPRLNRLHSAMRSLTKSLVSEAEMTETEAKSGENAPELDAFAAAFNVPCAPRSAPFEKGVHLLEATSFLKLIGLISTKARDKDGLLKIQNIEDAAKEVWETLADRAMKGRQEDACSTPTFIGDEYRLYATAKLLTFATLSTLGVSPWKSVDIEISPAAKYEAPTEAGLEFLIKCLVTCLDCQCDLSTSCSTQIMACLCTYIAIVYIHSNQLLLAARTNKNLEPFVAPLKALGLASVGIKSRTFERCFKIITSQMMSGAEAEICLRSLLMAIRGEAFLERFTGAQPRSNSVDLSTGTSPTGDHMWGGIDDAALLAAFGDEKEDEGAPKPQNLSSFLCNALYACKPSSLFAIENHSSVEDWKPSSDGKKLLANHTRDVCNCLAALAASENSSGAQSSVLNQLEEWDVPDESDKLYRDSLIESTSASLCSLAVSLPAAASLVTSHYQSCMVSAIDALLGMNILQKFFTCNMVRMEQISGTYGLRQELARIDSANRQQFSRFGRQLWTFIDNLAFALTNSQSAETQEYTTIGKRLAESRNTKCSMLEPHSLEDECCERVKVLLCMLTSEQSIQRLEAFSLRIIGKASFELLAVLKEFGLAARNHTNGSEASAHRYARKTELLSCFVEMHATLLCWILRVVFSGRKGHSLALISAKTHVVRFIGDVLNKRSKGVIAALHSMAALTGYDTLAFAGTQTCPDSDMMFRTSLLRRTKELLLYLAEQQVDGKDDEILSALLSIAAEEEEERNGDCVVKDQAISERVAKAFCRPQRKTETEASGASEEHISPLYRAVDHHTGQLLDLSEEQCRKLTRLRHKALREHLLHRLWRTQTAQNLLARKATLRLVQQIIEQGGKTSFSVEEGDKEVSMLMLRDLARGLLSSLRSHLEAQSVSEEFVSAVFSCARAFAACPISTGADQRTRPPSVACWSHATAARNEDSQEGLIASYVWYSFLWIKAVAELATNCVADPEALKGFRKNLKMDQDKWPLLETQEEAALIAAASRLFPNSKRQARCANVYSKGNSEEEKDAELQLWTPSGSVRRTATNFLVEVIPFS